MAEPAVSVAGVGWFDLDDVGAEVTEYRGRGGSGDETGDVDDA
jgi:hypothetical protein